MSEPSITQSGNNEIDVALPNANNAAEAQAIVGKTGQLYFYDWENSVIDRKTGKIAGANDPASHRRTPRPGSSGYVTEYQAVIAGSKQKPIRQNKQGKPVESTPDGSYYYVARQGQDRRRGPGVGAAQAGRRSSSCARTSSRRTASCRRARGSCTSRRARSSCRRRALRSTAIPGAYYVLRDTPFLTGNQITNPQATTDPTTGIVVSFGFKGGGLEHLPDRDRSARAPRSGQHRPGPSQNNLQHFAVTLGGQMRAR